MTSGTCAEVMTLWTMATSAAGVPASTSRATSRVAMRAVMALGLTGSPRSSTTKHRSASPSKARPRSAPCSTTAAWRSRRFSGSSGFASWLGKVPSSLEVERDHLERQGRKTGGGPEDGGDGVATHAVAGVDDDLERADAGEVDEAAQEAGVVGEQVHLGGRALVLVTLLRGAVERLLREVADLAETGVLADRARARTAEP